MTRLPAPPPSYNQRDQAELRRAIEDLMLKVQGLTAAVPAGGGGGTTPIASSTVSGTVKTDTDTADPIVYRSASVDTLLAAKAALASPTFTGDPKAPTPSPGDNDTSIATTAFVRAALKEPERASKVVTTASIANNADDTGTIDFDCFSTVLLGIAADRACWVRLYATSSARSSDASRLITVDPLAGAGVLAEFIFSASGTIIASPAPWLQNGDGTPAEAIYFAVRNLSGSTSTVQLTMLHVKQEEDN